VTITLLYFAAIRDLAGRDRESVVLPETVRDIAALSAWLDERESLRGRLAQVRFAINESFAQSPDVLHDGDVVALIPPVAGGSA
jgi:molybdopterin converting factor subunit 1